jgi:ABC-2 type transport system ATP-binding protein
VIEARGLRKSYNGSRVVDDVTFTVWPGRVTGFLGPNGAGKSTTMRMIAGLDRPSSGVALVNGKPHAAHRAPLREVGILLDAKAVHPGRSARDHLLAIAATHKVSSRRVDEVIALTGLESVARKRAGKFSLGMGQRLGLAVALLGDPQTLILDEPVNGLDPEGVAWVRHFLQELAEQGRTVFLSSHLMTEMAQTADHLVVIGRGRILADASMNDVIASVSESTVHVRTPQPQDLVAALASAGVTRVALDHDALTVEGATATDIAQLASGAAITLHELTPVSRSLEDAYLALTADAVEYQSRGAAETESEK